MAGNECDHVVTSMVEYGYYDPDTQEERHITYQYCTDCNKRVY